MDYCASSYKPFPIVESLPPVVKSNGDCKLLANLGSFHPSRNLSLLTQNSVKFCGFQRHFGGLRSCHGRKGRIGLVDASAGSSNWQFTKVNAPLKLKSSAGQFLTDIFQNQHQFFRAAVDEQLNILANDRDEAIASMKNSVGSADSSLHKKFAEEKEYECRISVEDVMYMLIVQKFSEIKVPMVPKLSRFINNGRVAIWPSKITELESVHSSEVLEMVREYLASALAMTGISDVTDSWSMIQMHRLKLSKIYAGSIMYGYFLKSVSLKHHLESSLALTNEDLSEQALLPLHELRPQELENLVDLRRAIESRSTSSCQGSGTHGMKHEKLKFYVKRLDLLTLLTCAKVKSKEAMNLIDNHTLAIFADEEMDIFWPDKVTDIQILSLKKLILEALTFGSFLWAVERHVETVYRLTDY